jgi:hypothetical protein
VTGEESMTPTPNQHSGPATVFIPTRTTRATEPPSHRARTTDGTEDFPVVAEAEFIIFESRTTSNIEVPKMAKSNSAVILAGHHRKITYPPFY